MYLSRTVVFDCGASRTALGIFERQGRRLRCVDFAVEVFPVSAGHEDHWLKNTCTALGTLRAHVPGPGPVVLVLPPHQVLTKLVKLPGVAPAQRDKIIRFEVGLHIPSALTEVVWDRVVVGKRDGGLEVLLAAAKSEVVAAICAAVQALGMTPHLILPSALATLAGFRLVSASPASSALVLNLGARSTTLLLSEGGGLVARTLAFGANHVTPQVSPGNHGTAGEVAATPLAAGGASLTAATVESFTTRLVQEITRSVLPSRQPSDRANSLPVYLAGGGARLAGLAESLAAKLSLPVVPLAVHGAVDWPDVASGPAAAGQTLALLDLIGAAATQLLPDHPVLNLLPPILRRQTELRRRQPWLLAAAVLVVAALLPPLWQDRMVTVEAQQKSIALETELAPLRERETRYRANLQQLAALRQQAAQWQDLYDRRVSWLQLFAELQERLGRVEDVWLEKLQVISAPATGPQKLAISGRLLDRANPVSRVGFEATNRVKTLLQDINLSPDWQVAEEGQRFDHTSPGILKFDFILVISPHHPL